MKLHEIQHIYDRNAQEYKNQTKDFVFPENMFELFLWQLSGTKVLDLWCAYGRDVSKLRGLWYQAFGLDISEKLLSICNPNIRTYLRHGDICQAKNIYSWMKFDGIVSSASIVHMSREDGEKVLDSAYQLLEENGIFYLSLKVSKSGTTQVKESISTPWIKKQYTYYKEDEIDAILQKIGFRILKTHVWKPSKDSWKILIAKK